MKTAAAQKLAIAIDEATSVSALLMRPADARACFVLAHGAGAGMTHSFMETVAAGLSERGVASLRYQFPYMEKASRRPDPPATAHAAVRAAVAEAGRCCAGLSLIAGGKSFGGRMTSQAQALAPLAGVHGLAFLGFPLHPAGKPSDDRAKHLADVHVPMLFVQGTRDSLAEIGRLAPVVSRLGRRRRCTESKVPIIPSMCWRVRDATTARQCARCWIRWQAGSRRSPGTRQKSADRPPQAIQKYRSESYRRNASVVAVPFLVATSSLSNASGGATRRSIAR
jgi:predicted alpha/beta-hydrolase family hydrolase